MKEEFTTIYTLYLFLSFPWIWITSSVKDSFSVKSNAQTQVSKLYGLHLDPKAVSIVQGSEEIETHSQISFSTGCNLGHRQDQALRSLSSNDGNGNENVT